MRRKALGVGVSVAAVVAALACWRVEPVRGATVSAAGWSQTTAASYLDSREIWWEQWPHAKKDQGTMCISCHTQVPYEMVRPALEKRLGESAAPAAETVMLASVEKRVAGWSTMLPFYQDDISGEGAAAKSHATEAMQNAIILTYFDLGRGHLRPITRTAFDEAWALQEKTGELAGGWIWQDFHMGPWEGDESGYQGTALFLKAVEDAPDHYADEPGVMEQTTKLEGYLRTHYAAQPVMNQLYVMWASGKAKDVLPKAEREALLVKVRGLQQADGGWCLSAMDRTVRKDKTPQSTESDGYATGLVVLAIEAGGSGKRDAVMGRGVAWLEGHQDATGRWPASSINKHRDLDSDVGKFMSDAATSYAVMALEKVKAEWSTSR